MLPVVLAWGRRVRVASAAVAAAAALVSRAAALAQGPGLELSFEQKEAGSGGPSFVVSGSPRGIEVAHGGALFNCCLRFSAEVTLEGSVLRVTERDGDPPCFCADIPWDVRVGILGLEPGPYDVYLHAKDARLLATAAVEVPRTSTAVFVRGAVNGDAAVDISDAVLLLSFLFLGSKGPPCLDAGDVNDDGTRDISDPIHLLEHLFGGGPAPPAPFPEAGEDPTEDGVVCSLENEVAAGPFVRDGDFNGDGQTDLTDGVALLAYLTLGGVPPACEDAVDGNDDGNLDLEDLCFVCPPCCPFLQWLPGPPLEPLSCGPDPTPDRLGCAGLGCGP
ncbi:MAG: hypothetical protein HY721_06720 [Planctomycetes bacterium]|nr:hypothetical protein [Planctomycetota bacterium]